MKRIKFTIIVFTVVIVTALFSACSKNSPADQALHPDTTKAPDSSAQAVAQPSDLNLSYEQRQGKYLYARYCMVCHGEEGKGDGFNSFNLEPKPRNFTDAQYMNSLTDDRIVQTITGGGRSVNRSVLMPSWGGRLQKQEIRCIVEYVRLFSKQ